MIPSVCASSHINAEFSFFLVDSPHCCPFNRHRVGTWQTCGVCSEWKDDRLAPPPSSKTAAAAAGRQAHWAKGCSPLGKPTIVVLIPGENDQPGQSISLGKAKENGFLSKNNKRRKQKYSGWPNVICINFFLLLYLSIHFLKPSY